MSTDVLVKKVMYVDDEQQNLDSFQFVFRKDYDISLSVSANTALEVLKEDKISLVITDQRMPGLSGLEFIQKAKKISPDTVFILLTAYADTNVILQALNDLKIFHYVQKPWNESQLKSIIDSGLQTYSLRVHNKQLFHQLEYQNRELNELNTKLHTNHQLLKDAFTQRMEYGDIITNNKKVTSILKSIESIASSDAPVLIQGETGTGKELIALAVHNLSERKNNHLVKVNCPALTESLIESELFGYEKGAFTGALKRKPGRFELANNGTLFLDEIGEIPMHVQAKLLRVIQEGEFERIGGTETIKTNVRIIAATNRDLSDSVSKNEFRSDLYYRLSVFPVHLPPLRERKDDILPLANFFLEKFSKHYNKKIKELSSETKQALLNYHWPGNIRELENVIERTVLLSHSSRLSISLSYFDSVSNNKELGLDDVVRQHIIKILELTNWKIHGKGGAADVLRLKPTTLQSKMLKYNISKP